MEKQPCVYIMTNRDRGTLYVGVTSNLVRRAWQHRNHLSEGFTKKYKLVRLVYYEMHSSMYEAIQREKAIKKWRRSWKIRLIEKVNPSWADLWTSIL
jgi:putative endonuclease